MQRTLPQRLWVESASRSFAPWLMSLRPVRGPNNQVPGSLLRQGFAGQVAFRVPGFNQTPRRNRRGYTAGFAPLRGQPPLPAFVFFVVNNPPSGLIRKIRGFRF
jgi:hypothetical protein